MTDFLKQTFVGYFSWLAALQRVGLCGAFHFFGVPCGDERFIKSLKNQREILHTAPGALGLFKQKSK